MTPSTALLIASVAVPPACLVVGFAALAWWWRRAQRRLQRDVLLYAAEQQQYKVTWPTAVPPGAEQHARTVDTRRMSGISIATTTSQDGSRVLARRSRDISSYDGSIGGMSEHALARRTSRPALSRPSSRRLSRPSSQDQHGVEAVTVRRNGSDLAHRDWSSELHDGAGDEDERTEELADQAAGVPGSADRISRSFAEHRAAEREERAARRRGSVFPTPLLPFDDAAGQFIAVQQPIRPPLAYQATPHHPHLYYSPASSPRRSRSGASRATGSSGGHGRSTRVNTAAPPPPLTLPQAPQLPVFVHSPAFPPCASTSSFPSNPLFDVPMHKSEGHHTSSTLHSGPYFRPTTRSEPSHVDTALFRASSSPSLRPHRQRPNPPSALHLSQQHLPRSSADFYISTSPVTSDSVLFFPSGEYLPPLPLSPAWPPPSPRTPRTPISPVSPVSPTAPHSAASPTITEFPVPSIPRPPRYRPPPADRFSSQHDSTRSLPSSTFGRTPSSPTAAPSVSSKWSFRRRPSASVSTTSHARWSKSSFSVSASGRAEKETRVKKELLAPLSASVRAAAKGAVEEEEKTEGNGEGGKEGPGDEEKKEEEGRVRVSSVGTLGSQVARGEGVGKVGNEVGVLTPTNPDPRSSTTASSARPSGDLSGRPSTETAPLPSS
ncbi:hypothetical protein JCM10213_008989 [Rhodosporidiobolus nylandii]